MGWIKEAHPWRNIQETAESAFSTFVEAGHSRWEWLRDGLITLRDGWMTLRAWRSNNHQIQQCLHEVEDAGIFASSPDCATLCEQIAGWRHRPIHLIAYPFTRNISGLVLARRNHDCIYFAEQAHPLLGMQAILHEAGHLLLGHVDRSPSLGESDQLTQVEIETALKRSCYDHNREVQAERMAYLLRRRWLEVRPPTYAMQDNDDANEQERLAWTRFTTYLGPLDPDF